MMARSYDEPDYDITLAFAKEFGIVERIDPMIPDKATLTALRESLEAIRRDNSTKRKNQNKFNSERMVQWGAYYYKSSHLEDIFREAEATAVRCLKVVSDMAENAVESVSEASVLTDLATLDQYLTQNFKEVSEAMGGSLSTPALAQAILEQVVAAPSKKVK